MTESQPDSESYGTVTVDSETRSLGHRESGHGPHSASTLAVLHTVAFNLKLPRPGVMRLPGRAGRRLASHSVTVSD